MAFLQSLWIAALLIIMMDSRARYGITASPPSFRVLSETLPDSTDLFLPIAAFPNDFSISV
jgi:hypothetical protein